MNRFISISKPLIWSTTLLLAAIVTGCGGSNGAAPGTLGISLTDAPACGFDAVNVTVVKVRVHQSSSATDTDAGWTDITLNPARKINLLDWNNGGLTTLGETPLAAGHYTQLRLVLDPNTGGGLANSVVPTVGKVETALVTPSAVQSGIKLINQFDVASGQRVDLVLDFNACKSIVTTGAGTYLLKPVIKVTPFVLNGIDGFVAPALLGSHVMVTAQQSGVVIQSTVPMTTGEFVLARVDSGNYDVVITADGHAMAVIAMVPVASTALTMVSTLAQPFPVPPVSATHTISGTVTLNPPDSTVVAYATAQQAVSTLPIITVKSQATDPSTGAYTLTLPIGAPQFVHYSTALPLVFADGTFTVGHYTDEASATGYVTQSLPEDISTTDATAQNFTLVLP